LRASAAWATSIDKSIYACFKANTKTADAIKDASAEKATAEYKVAKEKCDNLAGNAKDVCEKEAKARFGK